MFYIVIAAWLVGVIVSFIYGNRKLPITILLIGIGITVTEFTVGIGYFYISAMAVVAIIIWIANKLEMT